MGIIFKARGNNSIGLFLIRLICGAYFVGLGMIQAGNLQGYVNRIRSADVMSENFAYIAGFITPILLIVFGALFLIGFFTPTSSLILTIITFGKLIIKGLMPNPSSYPFSYNMILLACTLCILFSGAGLISFDALLDRKKKIKEPQPYNPPQPPPPPPIAEVHKENVSDATIIEEKKTEVKTEEKKDKE